jgi:hypothetical protein
MNFFAALGFLYMKEDVKIIFFLFLINLLSKNTSNNSKVSYLTNFQAIIQETYFKNICRLKRKLFSDNCIHFQKEKDN